MRSVPACETMIEIGRLKESVEKGVASENEGMVCVGIVLRTSGLQFFESGKEGKHGQETCAKGGSSTGKREEI